MKGRHLNMAPKKVRRIKRTARLRTAMGSSINPNARNVRHRGRKV